jgi:hypothetical protein
MRRRWRSFPNTAGRRRSRSPAARRDDVIQHLVQGQGVLGVSLIVGPGPHLLIDPARRPTGGAASHTALLQASHPRTIAAHPVSNRRLATVMRFRELVCSQALRSALERSSDTLLAFSLRAVERVVSDQSRTNRETINRLWDVLDDPHLNKALGLPQNSRMTFRRSGF